MKNTLLSMSLLFASPAWALSVSEPVTLSQPGFKNSGPQVAMNEEGEAVVVWVTKDWDTGMKKLSGATLGQDKKWSFGDVSQPGEDINYFRVFIDVKGNSYAQWGQSSAGSEFDIFPLAKKEKGSSWSQEVKILGSDDGLKYPKMVFDPQGNPLLFATAKMDNLNYLGAWTYQHETGEKKLAKIATFSAQPSYIRIVRNSKGNFFAVWTESVSGFNKEHNYYNQEFLQGAWSQEDAKWSKPVNIEVLDKSHSWVSGVKGAMNSSGDMVLLVSVRDSKEDRCRLQVFTCVDQKWSQPVELAQSKRWFSDLKLRFNDAGHAAIAWSIEEGEKEAIYILEKTGEGWSSPILLANVSRMLDLKVNIDDQGNTLAIWTAKDKRKWTPFAAYKAVGQNWQPAVALTDGKKACEGIKFFGTGVGNFGVIWSERQGYGETLHAALFSTKTQEWTPFTILPEGQVCRGFSCAFDKKGKGIVAWTAVNQMDEKYVQVAEVSLD